MSDLRELEEKLEEVWNHTNRCASKKLKARLRHARNISSDLGDRRDLEGLVYAEEEVERLEQELKDLKPEDVPKCDCGLEEAKQLLLAGGLT